MLISPIEGNVVTAKKVWDGVVLVDKVIKKTEEGSWKASIHEEGYQGLKDAILKIGGLN